MPSKCELVYVFYQYSNLGLIYTCKVYNNNCALGPKYRPELDIIHSISYALALCMTDHAYFLQYTIYNWFVFVKFLVYFCKEGNF
jgi:hypothetical protein